MLFRSDFPKALTIFNEILEKGFDGQNFISGLSAHLRDLLVCKDKATIPLLEASADIKENYAKQSAGCSEDLLFQALNITNNCDIYYKSSKNQRLHVEIALLQLCRILQEKKKPDLKPEPPKKEPVQQPAYKTATTQKASYAKETTSSDYKSQSISLKSALNKKEPGKTATEEKESAQNKENSTPAKAKEFTAEELHQHWKAYAQNIEKDAPRLFAILTAKTPALKEGCSIEFPVGNKLQEETVGKNLGEIQEFLKNELDNDNIQITITVEEEADDNKPRLYTDHDKFKYLSDKNPNLEKLRQQLNLDFI